MEKFSKSEKEIKDKLTEEEYFVLRQRGTEKPFSGKYLKPEKEMDFFCKVCNQKLFNYEDKYNSGCGWPSFDKAIAGSTEEVDDFSHGMVRKEVVCSKCKSHLGHVFPDGPKDTTGNRFCINSICLNGKNK